MFLLCKIYLRTVFVRVIDYVGTTYIPATAIEII